MIRSQSQGFKFPATIQNVLSTANFSYFILLQFSVGGQELIFICDSHFEAIQDPLVTELKNYELDIRNGYERFCAADF